MGTQRWEVGMQFQESASWGYLSLALEGEEEPCQYGEAKAHCAGAEATPSREDDPQVPTSQIRGP